MKTRYIHLLALAASLPMQADATTAAEYITAGRAYLLVDQDVPNAHTQFGNALALAPTNAEANVFYAVTILGTYIASEDCGALFILGGGEDLFWDATKGSPLRGIDPDTSLSVPADTLFDSDKIANSTTAFDIISGINITTLAAIDDAEAHLAIFSDTSPDIVITPAQLYSTDITTDIRIDYGDILLIRSALKFISATARIANGYNSDFEINTVDDCDGPQDFLATFPDALKVLTPAQWSDAKARLEAAATLYDEASDIIRARIDDDTHGFFHIVSDANYEGTNPETNNADFAESDEDQFRSYLGKMIDAFDSVQTETISRYELTGYDVDGYPTWASEEHTISFTLDPFVSGEFDIRTLIPELSNDQIIRNSFPDPTMDGILPGIDQGTLDLYIQDTYAYSGEFNSYERTNGMFSNTHIDGWLGCLDYVPDWECGWYYSEEHAYVFPMYNSGAYWLYQDTLFLYIADFDAWVFTNEDIYPWMYRYSTLGAWLYYWPGQSANSRWYYNYATTDYEHISHE